MAKTIHILLILLLLVCSQRSAAGAAGAAGAASAALLHFNAGQNEAARQKYTEALSLYRAQADLRGEGWAYLGLADLALRESSNDNALELARQAQRLLTAASDASGQGHVFRIQGSVAFYLGDNDRALELLDQALGLFSRAGDLAGAGDAQRIKGDIYFRTGDTGKARESYAASRASCAAAGYPIGQGRAAWSLASTFLRGGEFQKALEYNEEALTFFTRSGYPIGLGNVYKTEGDIYRFTGNGPKALASYGRARLHYAAADSLIGQGNVYKSEGNVRREGGQDPAARELFEKAITCYATAKSPIGLGEVHLALADLASQAGDRARAEEHYQKALGFLTQANDLAGQGNVAQGRGDLQRAAGATEKALELYRKANGIFARLADTRSQAFSLFRQASVLEQRGANAEAAKLYEESISLLERVRRQSGVEEMKKSFTALTYGLYEAATLFMIGQQYQQRAFQFAESMKARVFLDQLAEAAVDYRQGVDPALDRELSALERERSLLTVQLKDELKKGSAGATRVAKINAELEQNDLARDALVIRIRLTNPRFAQVEYPEPVRVADIQKLLGANEVLLEYFSAEAGTFCFLVTREQFQVVKLAVSRDDLETKVRNLVGFIREPENLGAGVPASKDRLARELYDILLGPFGGLLKDKSLLLVPDGILTLLPFEMLRAGDRYALEQHDIRYFQSASVLGFIRGHRKKEVGTGALIGFGDPVYDYQDFKAGTPERGALVAASDPGAVSLTRGAYLRSGGGLDRLEGSGAEVSEIARLAREKGVPAEKRLRQEATVEAAVSPSMARFSYIHFSAHGIIQDRLQAVALSQLGGSAEDSFLTLGKIMSSHYDKARLVVLSACETGLGKMERGEGVSGLTRAVMYAGSPAALVSLWSVDDQGTRELMVRLYRGLLRQGKTPHEALRSAKLSLVAETNGYEHPFFWAPFVLYGE